MYSLSWSGESVPVICIISLYFLCTELASFTTEENRRSRSTLVIKITVYIYYCHCEYLTYNLPPTVAINKFHDVFNSESSFTCVCTCCISVSTSCTPCFHITYVDKYQNALINVSYDITILQLHECVNVYLTTINTYICNLPAI